MYLKWTLVKNIRLRKKKNVLKQVKYTPNKNDRLALDKHVFDTVLRCLYDNADKSELGFESEILPYTKLKLPKKEISRLWNVLASSPLVAPAVGFGRAGKLELTQAGYQLMSQFGGYKQYLETMENNQKPQTIIMPISVTDEEDSTPPPAEKK